MRNGFKHPAFWPLLIALLACIALVGIGIAVSDLENSYLYGLGVVVALLTGGLVIRAHAIHDKAEGVPPE